MKGYVDVYKLPSTRLSFRSLQAKWFTCRLLLAFLDLKISILISFFNLYISSISSVFVWVLWLCTLSEVKQICRHTWTQLFLSCCICRHRRRRRRHHRRWRLPQQQLIPREENLLFIRWAEQQQQQKSTRFFSCVCAREKSLYLHPVKIAVNFKWHKSQQTAIIILLVGRSSSAAAAAAAPSTRLSSSLLFIKRGRRSTITSPLTPFVHGIKKKNLFCMCVCINSAYIHGQRRREEYHLFPTSSVCVCVV